MVSTCKALHFINDMFLQELDELKKCFRFTWRMKLLTGRRGVAILYAYMLLGLGFLRIVTPDFGDLASKEQQLEGTFRSLDDLFSAFTYMSLIN